MGNVSSSPAPVLRAVIKGYNTTEKMDDSAWELRRAGTRSWIQMWKTL